MNPKMVLIIVFMLVCLAFSALFTLTGDWSFLVIQLTALAGEVAVLVAMFRDDRADSRGRR